jgi:hypothetical protein
MDGAYASQAWRDPPERVTVTPRMRGNAALHKLPAASRKPGQMGRTPLKGAKTPHPRRDRQHRALQENHRHQPGRTSAHRAHPRVRLPLVQAVLHPAGQRDPDPHPGTTDGFDVALASTDIDATPPNCSPATTPAGRSKPATKRPRPTASATPETESNEPSNGPSVRVPRPNNHDRLVRRSRQPRSRPRPAPPPVTLVTPEGDRQLHRHARRATPRTHPPRVLGTSTPDDHQRETHTTPVAISIRGRLRARKSSSTNHHQSRIRAHDRPVECGGRGALTPSMSAHLTVATCSYLVIVRQAQLVHFSLRCIRSYFVPLLQLAWRFFGS